MVEENSKDWKDICRAFYTGDKKSTVVQEVMNAFATVGTDELYRTDSKETENVLRTIGFQITKDGKGWELPTELIVSFEETKNRIRKTCHLEAAEKRRRPLENLIDRYVEEQRKNEREKDFVVDSIFMRKTIESIEKNPGASPFLNGLRACLRDQIGSNRVMRWRFSDAVLTETNDQTFGKEAVRLLCDALDFTPEPTKSIDRDTRTRSWFVSSRISDFNIRRALLELPANRRGFSATGKRDNTDQIRHTRYIESGTCCDSCGFACYRIVSSCCFGTSAN